MDRDRGGNHPYWPPNNVNDPDYSDIVEQYTFNPMRFVQAHEVYLAFATPAAATYYIDASWGQPTASVSESDIDHEWFSQGPALTPVFPRTDEFSVKWDGQAGAGSINIPHPAVWTFYVTVDDGFSFYLDTNHDGVVDPTPVLQSLSEREYPESFQYSTFLQQGIYKFKLYYREYYDLAAIQLAWQPPQHMYMSFVKYDVVPTPTRTPTRTPTFTRTRTPTPTGTYTLAPTPTGGTFNHTPFSPPATPTPTSPFGYATATLTPSPTK